MVTYHDDARLDLMDVWFWKVTLALGNMVFFYFSHSSAWRSGKPQSGVSLSQYEAVWWYPPGCGGGTGLLRYMATVP